MRDEGGSSSTQLSAAFRAQELRGLILEAFAVQERGVDLRAGLAGAIATAVPLAVGVALGHRVAGLIAAVAGLNTALCVPRGRLSSRLWWGGLCAFAGAGAVVVADLVGSRTWLLALVTVLWVGAMALLRSAGSQGALVGFAASAVFVILAGVPTSGPPLTSRLLWFAAGAAGGLAVMAGARGWSRRGGGAAQEPGAPARAGAQQSMLGATVSAVREGAVHDPRVRIHALRLALGVVLATVVERVLKMPHGAWVPLTVLAILQPGEHATNVRVIQRAAGTVVGVAVIVAITAVTGAVWVLVGCTAAVAAGLFALDQRGYFWLVVMLTPTALLMLSVSDFQGVQVGVQRTLSSALGIALGVVIGEIGWRLGPRAARNE